ncbi:MAG: dTMP kinase [Syntrophaceae bacterium]|nr:dTMP kinase [Syntrophaceae bacterium]
MEKTGPTGKFVTFEGVEGAGKTTQLRLAVEWLEARGLSVLATAEPGGTSLGQKIREILLNRSAWAISAEAELLLFAAARAQHVREAIMPALERGQWVLCDRFSDATLAYQGFGRGLDAAFIRCLNGFSSRSLSPDLTLLFDLSASVGLARARERAAGLRPEAAEDRFEQETLAFHGRIRKGYLSLAAEEPDRYRIVDAARGIEAIQGDVRRCLETSWRGGSARRDKGER